MLNGNYEKYSKIWGYIDVFDEVKHESHYNDEIFYDEVLRHREKIWEKYRPAKSFFCEDELMCAVSNHHNLTSEEVMDIISKVRDLSVVSWEPDIIGSHFILPGQYPGTIVDLEDIFAVGYASVYIDENAGMEGIICLCFTNDPYMPVFPSHTEYGYKFYQNKSKSGRKTIESIFSSVCPNLRYPVQELRTLKRQIKREGAVRGNIEKSMALELIDSAICQTGPYREKHLATKISADAWEQVKKHGYIDFNDAKKILASSKAEKKYANEVSDLLDVFLQSV